MHLSSEQVRKANLFHRFLKNQRKSYFKDSTINKCGHCNATGLSGTGKLVEGGFTWDTASYCSRCNGIGYIGIAGHMKIDETHFICKHCDGIGCIRCKNEGLVDWVTNIMG